MKKLYFAIFLTAVSFSLFAQVENYKIKKKNIWEATYYQDYVNFTSDKPGLSRMDVFIQVPYKNIQFVKSGNGFTAKYFVTASVFDESKKQLIVEKTWNEIIDVMDYNLTVSKDNYHLSKKSIDLRPGNYFIKTRFEDKDSKQEALGENTFIAKSFDETLSLSDILLIYKTDFTQGKSEIVPNVSRNFASSKDEIKFYFEVYSKDSLDIKKAFEYSVLNSENQIIHKESEDRTITPGTNKIFHNLSQFPFDLGAYTLVISILDSNQMVASSTKKSFYSHWKGLPGVINDIDKSISQLVYIGTPNELDYIKEGETITEKTKRFLEFWKKKDPSPNNEENEVFDEYYRRVAYAEGNFSTYIDGWRSDRGMVFIILGAPNNIDRHPFEYDSKPYEVWEYYDLNRSFIFLDETGFGDYRLITPLTGDLYRYRY
jgi:GWxTD domain-containing protein